MEKVKTIGELYMHIVYERSIKIADLLSLGPYQMDAFDKFIEGGKPVGGVK